MTTARKLYRRQIKALRKSRAFALDSARFVRTNSCGSPLTYVQKAWRDHSAIMQMLRLGEPT